MHTSRHARRETRSLFRLIRGPLVAVVTSVAVILTGLGWLPSAASATGNPPVALDVVTARPVQEFLDRIGVNAHPTYYQGPYENHPNVIADLRYLGITHIRTDLNLTDARALPRLTAMAQARIRFNFLPPNKPTYQPANPDLDKARIDTFLGSIRDNFLGSTDSVEGANEWNHKSGTGRLDPNWAADDVRFQALLYNEARSDSYAALNAIPVLGPSLIAFLMATDAPTLSTTATAYGTGVSGHLDSGSLHTYAGDSAPESASAKFLERLRLESQYLTGGRPVTLTETGYHNAMASNNHPVSEAVGASYLLRSLAFAFAQNLQRTYLYELLDQGKVVDGSSPPYSMDETALTDQEAHYGLFHFDNTPKEAAVAIHNLTTILADSGPQPPAGALSYGFTGDTTGLRSVLLQKSDGAFYLMLWRDTAIWNAATKTAAPVAPSDLGVQLATSAGSLRLYDPRAGTDGVAVAQSPDGSAVVPVGADLVMLKIGRPAPLDVTAPTATLTAPAARSVATGSVGVTADVADDTGVTAVRFKVDGNDAAVDAPPPSAPAVFDWNSATVPDGSHTLQAVAEDAAGNTGSSAIVTVTVDNADRAPPAPPSALVATAVSETEIDLSWQAASDNVGVTGYQIFRDGTWLATVPAGTAYRDTGRAESTAYSYSVLAADAAGNLSAPSNEASATTPSGPDTTPPVAPGSVTATAAGGTQVTVAWRAASDNRAVTGYHVYRDGTLVATVGAVTSYQDTGLRDAQTYSYQVQAFDAAGNTSALSVGADAVTPDVSAPSAPSNVTATVASPRRIDVSWGAVTDNVGVTGYRLYRNGLLVATLGAVTSYSDTTVADGATYTYSVRGFDAAGNVGDPTAAFSATTPDVTAPTVPSGLRSTGVSYTSVNLAFDPATDNVGVAGYWLYRNDTLIASLSGTTFLDTGLTQGTSYTYSVSANDAIGNRSAASPGLLVSARSDDLAPSVPTGVRAVVTQSYLVTLSWTTATDSGGSGLTGYRVYRSDKGSTPIATVPAGATAYRDTLVRAGTSYTYQVLAYDQRGNASAKSGGIAATTARAAELKAPTRPTNLHVVSVTTNSIKLAWTASSDNSGVKGYHVYRNGGYIGDAGTAGFADSGLAAATSYQYYVVAFDGSANVSPASAAIAQRTR